MVEYTDYFNREVTPLTEYTRKPFRESSGYPKQEEFIISAEDRKYDRQYFSMYQYRFKKLKERIIGNAIQKWGDGTRKVNGQTIVKQDKILDITSGKLCWVIGTVFCDLKDKLNILQDVEKGIDDVLPLVPDSYVGDDENSMTTMLEDESGRAILHNEEFLSKNILVTGCIVGVLGIEISAGVFEIMDVVYPEASPQKSLTLRPSEGKGKVAIVSGLNLEEGVDADLRLELLKQYVTGCLGSSEDADNASNICRLIIAGDSVKPIKEVSDRSNRDFVTTNNYGSKNISQYNPESLVKFDEFLREILVSLPVSVMPGDNDMGEICLPQSPLHKSLFHSNAKYLNGEYLERLTNPHWFNFGDLRVLGTSGQNVHDILKYLPKNSTAAPELTLKIIEAHIKWQNFIPTAPDTLYCYPFDNSDPFTLEEETPHVYFVGNQQVYASGVYNYTSKTTGSSGSVTLVSVPRFSETGELVLLDLDTLETEVVQISL